MENFDNIKHAHFIGIGGIGVSAAAKYIMAKGKTISGSDGQESETTDFFKNKGIEILIGHKKENLKENVDLVIYSPAIGEDNPERIRAKELEIPQLSYPEFLGVLSRQMKTIAVSGTKGKSTTTAILGLILEKAGLDPTVIVGSKIKSFEYGNLRIGSEKENSYFAVEACEYKAAMLALSPQNIILTNIEADHLDFYRDIEHIKDTFLEYARKLEKNGLLVYNADDKICAEIAKKINVRKLSYGIANPADLNVCNIRIENQQQSFELVWKEKIIGDISLKVPGKMNIYNALAAIAQSLEIGIDVAKIKESAENFRGIWRRFDIVGKYKGAKVISDYAHNPMSVKAAIEAAKEFYPDKKIIAVFQPHSWNRTKKLFNEFTESFDEADEIILSEVYQVAGRENIEDKISSSELSEAIKKRPANRSKKIIFTENLKECEKIVSEASGADSILLIMGAGDIYKIADNLIR